MKNLIVSALLLMTPTVWGAESVPNKLITQALSENTDDATKALQTLHQIGRSKPGLALSVDQVEFILSNVLSVSGKLNVAVGGPEQKRHLLMNLLIDVSWTSRGALSHTKNQQLMAEVLLAYHKREVSDGLHFPISFDPGRDAYGVFSTYISEQVVDIAVLENLVARLSNLQLNGAIFLLLEFVNDNNPPTTRMERVWLDLARGCDLYARAGIMRVSVGQLTNPELIKFRQDIIDGKIPWSCKE